MKICAYLTVCLCLPFVLLAEDEEEKKAASSPDEETEAVEAVTDPGFERFKTILDRMPFGRTPPGFNPDEPSGPVEARRGSAESEADAAEAEASEIEQQILSSVRVSMLNRTADGRVFVGFTDSSVQPAKNYLLELGEKREKCEWLVVGADPDNRQVTLSKGGVEATLKVGGGASDDKDKNAKVGGKPGGRPAIARGRHHPGRPEPDAEGDDEEKMSPIERVRARRREHIAKQQAEEEQKRQAAEQAKKDRETAAEERKEQLAQLAQIQEELRRQREEKLAEQERRAAEEDAPPQGEAQPVEE